MSTGVLGGLGTIASLGALYVVGRCRLTQC